MKIPRLRSSCAKVGGLVSFGRLLDKIRLNAQGTLPDGWVTGSQVGADQRCVSFLHVTYEALAERVMHGGTDEEVLAWCFQHGRQPGAEDIEVWNEFSMKRGWRDNSTKALETAKREAGLGHRGDIQTWFDFQDADEERESHTNVA
jgi:gluconokinase